MTSLRPRPPTAGGGSPLPRRSPAQRREESSLPWAALSRTGDGAAPPPAPRTAPSASSGEAAGPRPAQRRVNTSEQSRRERAALHRPSYSGPAAPPPGPAAAPRLPSVSARYSAHGPGPGKSPGRSVAPARSPQQKRGGPGAGAKVAGPGERSPAK